MSQYLVKLCVNHQTIDCVPLNAGEPGLGLDEQGITWLSAESPVRIEIADDGELHITGNSEQEICIIRSGRRRMLQKGQSFRLLMDDEIHIGKTEIRVQSVMKNRLPKIYKWINEFREKGCTAASSFVTSACDVVKTIFVKKNEVRGKMILEKPCGGRISLSDGDLDRTDAYSEDQEHPEVSCEPAESGSNAVTDVQNAGTASDKAIVDSED